MREMVTVIKGLSYRHTVWDVFSDFVEMAALSISNAIDKRQFETREARYLEIINKYNKEEQAEFPRLFALLVSELEKGMSDVLGSLFHELELHNKYKGQYFTPYPISQMMAKITAPSNVKAALGDKGFVTACEPTCGSGVMVIALAEAINETGQNYQQCLHVTAADLDLRCVHMAYVQLALYHIPAVVVHANTITLEEYSHWYTPAHILGQWECKLRHKKVENSELVVKGPYETPAIKASKAQADIQLNLF